MQIINNNGFVTNVKYSELKLSWSYNNKHYEYKTDDDIIFAKEFEQNGYIFIRSNDVNASITFTYITLEGKFILSWKLNYSRNSDEILILNEKNEKIAFLPNEKVCDITVSAKNILIAFNGEQPKIIVYSQYGKNLRKYIIEKQYDGICRFFQFLRMMLK